MPLIVNRQAGGALARRLRGIARPEEAEGEQGEAGKDSIGATRVVEAGAVDMRDVIRAAVREGPGIVAVGGGDGTMHAAAQVLAGSTVALLPVPTGTLNHFARRQGVRTLDDARRALDSGQDRRVTLGVADERVFLNTLVIGAYARVVRRRERLRRFLPRWPAAMVAFALTLVAAPRVRVRLEMATGARELRTPLVWIGLGRGSYPRSLEPDRGREPLLEVVVLRATGRLAVARFLLRLAFRLITGRDAATDPALEILRTPHLLIRGAEALPATVDGERVTLHAPVFVSAVAEGLLVRIPPG